MIPRVIKRAVKEILPKRPPLPERQWLQAEALFTITTGRTGTTTTLLKLLNTSPHLLVSDEPEPQLLEALRSMRIRPWEVTEERMRLFKDARARLISRAHRRGRVYVEGGGLKWLAPTIAELMPRAKFLFLHRHPFEFIVAGLKRGWYSHHINDPYRIVPASDEPAAAQWSNWTLVQRITWHWNIENRYFLDVLERLGPNRVLEIPFNILVDSNAAPHVQLFDFLGVEVPRSSRISRILATRYNAEADGQALTPGEWADDTLQFIEQHAGDTMARLGYAVRASNSR